MAAVMDAVRGGVQGSRTHRTRLTRRTPRQGMAPRIRPQRAPLTVRGAAEGADAAAGVVPVAVVVRSK